MSLYEFFINNLPRILTRCVFADIIFVENCDKIKGKTMTIRYRVAAIIIAVLTLSLSTFGGVLAAQKLTNISFTNNQINYAALDEIDGDVGMVNVLLIGVDEGGYRSDTIMLASLDGHSNRVSILSIPRDTMVKINGSTQKINATMGFAVSSSSPDEPIVTTTPDPLAQELNVHPSKLSMSEGHEDLLIEKIKGITGLPIHYFVTVDFDGFVEVIEALDGVDFDVPYDMDYDDPVQSLHIHLKAGPQHLDGAHAHQFVRFRHNNNGSAPGEYVMGDEGRIHWQQQFIKEVINQKLNAQYLSKINEVFTVVKNNVRTNLTVTDVARNLNALTKVNLDDITTYQLPGEYEYTDNLWYYIHSQTKTDELINNVFRPQSREEWKAYLAEQETPEPTAE